MSAFTCSYRLQPITKECFQQQRPENGHLGVLGCMGGCIVGGWSNPGEWLLSCVLKLEKPQPLSNAWDRGQLAHFHFICYSLHALPTWFPTLSQRLRNDSAELSLVTKGASVEEACLLVRETSVRRENKGSVQCLGKKVHGAQWCERHRNSREKNWLFLVWTKSSKL